MTIPNNATNGDVIKTIFPNMRITVFYNSTVPYVMVIGENGEFNNTYPLTWWNSLYQKGNK